MLQRRQGADEGVYEAAPPLACLVGRTEMGAADARGWRLGAPGTVSTGQAARRPPLPVRLMSSLPFVQRLAGRLIGLGVRPEHVPLRPADLCSWLISAGLISLG